LSLRARSCSASTAAASRRSAAATAAAPSAELRRPPLLLLLLLLPPQLHAVPTSWSHALPLPLVVAPLHMPPSRVRWLTAAPSRQLPGNLDRRSRSSRQAPLSWKQRWKLTHCKLPPLPLAAATGLGLSRGLLLPPHCLLLPPVPLLRLLLLKLLPLPQPARRSSSCVALGLSFLQPSTSNHVSRPIPFSSCIRCQSSSGTPDASSMTALWQLAEAQSVSSRSIGCLEGSLRERRCAGDTRIWTGESATASRSARHVARQLQRSSVDWTCASMQARTWCRGVGGPRGAWVSRVRVAAALQQRAAARSSGRRADALKHAGLCPHNAGPLLNRKPRACIYQ